MNSLRRLIYKHQVSTRLFNASPSKKFTTANYLKSYNFKTNNNNINNLKSIKVKPHFPSNLLKELALKNSVSKPFSSTSTMLHTRVEEELHDNAHIDYDRVDIQWNPSVAQLYEDALKYENGSPISSTGALVTASGIKTGRSPKDKRIVDEPGSTNEIWVSMDSTRDLSLTFTSILVTR
jgi:hypothetical protein